MRALVTGGAGFIGSNLVRFLLRERPAWEVVNLDLLTYAAVPASLDGLDAEPRYRFVQGDICDPDTAAAALEGVDAVFHLAAESHVDRSIRGAAPFVRTNVVGTQTLLDAAREAGVERFVHVSTDEVYGDLPWRDPSDAGDAERFTERTPLQPRSPYAASKAAADHLVRAQHVTHGLDTVTTRCSNNYGPRQHPEKLIPLMALNALDRRPLPVYGDGLNVRDWIHVDDHCRGLLAALERGRPGRVYNLGGECERTNLQVVRAVLAAAGAPESLIRFVEDRPGHDRRYAVDVARARDELGWAPARSFEDGVRETVAWYRASPEWCDAARSRTYWDWYEEQYA